MITITANEILAGLWQVLNGSPKKTGGLTNRQIATLERLMEIRGCEEFLTTVPAEEIDRLLHRLWDFAHMAVAKEPRTVLRTRALATSIALRIMRCRADRTGEEHLFYWRHGHWPNQLLM